MQLKFSICRIEDCTKVLGLNWSKQARAVVHFCIVAVIYFIWQSRNMLRFEGIKTSWKHCVSKIMAQARLVGNVTKMASNGSIESFCVLKLFDITIHDQGNFRTKEVLWMPPLMG